MRAGALMIALMLAGPGCQPSGPPTSSPSLQPPARPTFDDSSRVPWVIVANGGSGPVEVRLWAGSRAFVSQCGTKQGFPKASDPLAAPSPPWHLTVRDAATGRLMAEKRVSASEPGQFVHIFRDQVNIGHIPGPPSGPAVFCAPTAG
jgi:hypothetical protein